MWLPSLQFLVVQPQIRIGAEVLDGAGRVLFYHTVLALLKLGQNRHGTGLGNRILRTWLKRQVAESARRVFNRFLQSMAETR